MQARIQEYWGSFYAEWVFYNRIGDSAYRACWKPGKQFQKIAIGTIMITYENVNAEFY